MMSEEIQILLAKNTGKIPALVDLYDDPDVLRALPFLDQVSMKDLFTGNQVNNKLVVRSIDRSKVTIKNYDKVSNIFYSRVHEMLLGEVEISLGVQEMWKNLINSFPQMKQSQQAMGTRLPPLP
jgi:hypothetical protein